MLALRGLHKRFGDLVAVDGLSLEVRRGEILGLLGPNGAGKTTTIHMAVGLLAPDQGTVDVDGRGSPRRRISGSSVESRGSRSAHSRHVWPGRSPSRHSRIGGVTAPVSSPEG